MTESTLVSHFKKLSVLFLVSMSIMGCSLGKSNYHREYTRVWKEIIKSEAWKNSLMASNSDDVSDYIEISSRSTRADSEEDRFTTELDMEALFEERYQSLVSRAYFKIIAEAKKADVRLRAEYDRYTTMQQDANLKKDKTFKKEYESVSKKYNAHKRMLQGLTSWNIFSEYRTNDLDFFKAENKDQIHKMYNLGRSEEQIINYLLYKLADLYHFEDQ